MTKSPQQPVKSDPRICVLGAGPSGLAMGRRLLEAGLRNFVIYDRQQQIGGNWNEGDPSGHSSAYEGVRSISSTRRMQFPGVPFPPGTEDYPSRRDLLQYLGKFSSRFQLQPYLVLNTQVIAVEPVGPRERLQWRVSFSSGGSSYFDAVCVCNGHHSVPLLPEWHGSYTGRLLHAHDFNTSFGFGDQRILVVGGGNSAADIASDLARRCGHVTLSLRRGYHVLPRHILGLPSDEFHARIHWIPDALVRRLAPLLFRLAHGKALRKWPRPDHPLFATHPLIHSELPRKVASGEVELRGAIMRAHGTSVIFRDGTEQAFDTIVACTGYQITFPFLRLRAGALPPAQKLHLSVFHPEHPSLYFLGLIQPNGSIWPLADLQAQLVAKHLRGSLPMPVRSPAYKAKSIASPRHTLEVDFFRYRHALQRALRTAS